MDIILKKSYGDVDMNTHRDYGGRMGDKIALSVCRQR